MRDQSLRAALMIAVFVSPDQAVAQTAPITTTMPILGTELESIYLLYLQGCGLPNGLKDKKPKKSKASIDPAVARELGANLTRETGSPIAASLGYAFSYVWTQAEGSSGRTTWSNLRLPLDQRQIAAVPVDGLPSVVQQSSCASIVGGHLQASGGASFPVGTLSMALKAEANRTAQTRLTVMDGTVANPIWKMWDGRDIDNAARTRDQVYAGLVFWAWRAALTAPQQAIYASGAKVLTRYNGSYVFRSTRSGDVLKADASAEARAAFGVSVTSTLSSSVQKDSTLTVEDFKILVRLKPGTNNPDWEMADLPSATAIATMVGQASLHSEIVGIDGAKVDAQIPKDFYLYFPSLPAGLCDNNEWTIEDVASASTLNSFTFISKAVLDNMASEGSSCRFTARFKPGSSNSNVENMDLRLRSKRFIEEGTPLKQVRLDIRLVLDLTRRPVPTVEYASSATPSIAPAAGPGSNTIVNVTYYFDVRQLADYGGDPGVNTDDVFLNCPGGFGGAHPKWSSKLQGDGAIRTLALTGSSTYGGVLPSNPSTQDCKISGTIKLRRTSGIIEIPATIQPSLVKYPQPAAN